MSGLPAEDGVREFKIFSSAAQVSHFSLPSRITVAVRRAGLPLPFKMENK